MEKQKIYAVTIALLCCFGLECCPWSTVGCLISGRTIFHMALLCMRHRRHPQSVAMWPRAAAECSDMDDAPQWGTAD